MKYSNKINFTVNVIGGKRTPVSVNAVPFNQEGRFMGFKNGQRIYDTEIAEMTEKYLTEKLKEIQNERI